MVSRLCCCESAQEIVRYPDYDIYAVGAPAYASYAVYASPWAEEDAA